MNENIRKVLEIYAKEEHWQEYYEDELYGRPTGSTLGDDLGEAERKLLAEMTDTPAPQEHVTVKAIEWEAREDSSYRGLSAIGYYHVFPGTGFSYDLCGPVGGRLATYKRLEEAKAAAQTDYTARVLSALAVEPPKGNVRVEPLKWRSGWRNSRVTIIQADAICGVYQVRTLDGVVWLDKPSSQTIYPSADEAKAAAQADHEARINEYLVHAPKDHMVASIVPPHCSGSSLVFEPGVLHVQKDGSGYIVVNEDDFVLEDDRCEGPDGPEGSVHWIVRMDASEIAALRDFLNGALQEHVMVPPIIGETIENLTQLGKYTHDIETRHIQADDLLCEVIVAMVPGGQRIVDAFKAIRKVYA